MERRQPTVWKLGELPSPEADSVASVEDFPSEPVAYLWCPVGVHMQNVDVMYRCLGDSMKPAQIFFTGWIAVFVIDNDKWDCGPFHGASHSSRPLGHTHL